MKPLIISLGHRFRSDDGAGPRVLDKLRGRLDGGADFVECPGDVMQLLDAWQDRPQVCIIDAFFSEQEPAGNIQRLDGLSDVLPAPVNPASSHALNLPEAVELGKVLHKLPQQLCVYAISGKSFNPGADLTPEVERAVDRVTEVICNA